jgi:hypothetical protein
MKNNQLILLSLRVSAFRVIHQGRYAWHARGQYELADLYVTGESFGIE